MIPRESILRVARPTDNLDKIKYMYMAGLGFSLLGEFYDHDGFDGVILGHDNHNYHLEFTHHKGQAVGGAPTKDNLLVFYIPDNAEWASACSQMVMAGFNETKSYNPYWDVVGKTFEDIDGYRVVLQNRQWATSPRT